MIEADITNGGLKDFSSLSRDEKILRVFEHLDHDGSGSLDLHEMLTIAGKLTSADDLDRAKQNIAYMDHDGDNMISLEEFTGYMAFAAETLDDELFDAHIMEILNSRRIGEVQKLYTHPLPPREFLEGNTISVISNGLEQLVHEVYEKIYEGESDMDPIEWLGHHFEVQVMNDEFREGKSKLILLESDIHSESKGIDGYRFDSFKLCEAFQEIGIETKVAVYEKFREQMLLQNICGTCDAILCRVDTRNKNYRNAKSLLSTMQLKNRISCETLPCFGTISKRCLESCMGSGNGFFVFLGSSSITFTAYARHIILSTPHLKHEIEVSEELFVGQYIPCAPILILESANLVDRSLDGYGFDTLALADALENSKIRCRVQFFDVTQAQFLGDLISSGGISCIIFRISPESLRRSNTSMRSALDKVLSIASECNMAVYDGIPSLPYETFSENVFCDFSFATDGVIHNFAREFSKYLHTCRALEISSNPDLLKKFTLDRFRSYP